MSYADGGCGCIWPTNDQDAEAPVHECFYHKSLRAELAALRAERDALQRQRDMLMFYWKKDAQRRAEFKNVFTAEERAALGER